jgi:hypothetical protein
MQRVSDINCVTVQFACELTINFHVIKRNLRYSGGIID